MRREACTERARWKRGGSSGLPTCAQPPKHTPTSPHNAHTAPAAAIAMFAGDSSNDEESGPPGPPTSKRPPRHPGSSNPPPINHLNQVGRGLQAVCFACLCDHLSQVGRGLQGLCGSNHGANPVAQLVHIAVACKLCPVVHVQWRHLRPRITAHMGLTLAEQSHWFPLIPPHPMVCVTHPGIC